MQEVRLILDLNSVLIIVDFPRPHSPGGRGEKTEGGEWRGKERRGGRKGEEEGGERRRRAKGEGREGEGVVTMSPTLH